MLNKLFERVIYSRINKFCEEGSVLAEVQFGFRTGHSTAQLLQRVINIINEKKRSSCSTAMALLDIEKAFLKYAISKYCMPLRLTV